MTERKALLEAGIREWLAEEERQAAEARAAADSYRGIDIEACVDMCRSAAQHTATAHRIRKILYLAREPEGVGCPSPGNPCMCACHRDGGACRDCSAGRHKPKVAG